MARKAGPTISQDESYPLADETGRDERDVGLLDLDVEAEPPFLRVQRRVPARRSLPRKTLNRLRWIAGALGVAFVCSLLVGALYHYGERSWRFRIESSDDIEIGGLQNVTRTQILEVMGGDIGRNIFFVPLTQRQEQLEQIPWVESASVMRFVPNHLRIQIHERTPVAFARVGSKILLTDAAGTLMELPGKKKYSFPVIIGMNTAEPLSTRLARMKIYNDVISQLDAGGARYSQDLSEIDLSDPDDVKVLASHGASEVLVHLGSSHYLERYKVYVTHVQEWQQQFSKLESVDLRYDRQIIVNPDLQGTAKQPPLSPAAAKQAVAAGVKPAALITRITPAAKPLSNPVVSTAGRMPLKTTLRLKTATGPRHRVQARRVARPRGRSRAGTHKPARGLPKSAGMTGAQYPGKMHTSLTVVRSGSKPSPAIAKGEDPQ